MVDAVRFGMLGISDAAPSTGGALVGLLAVGALICPWLLLRSGWRLRG
jgi:ABC-2 type transport system permease protein